MFNTFYTHLPVEETHTYKSALEIAQAARRHERQMYDLLNEGIRARKTRRPIAEGVLSVLKSPVHLLTMAGQWLFLR